MRYIFILFLFVANSLMAQKSIYDIKISVGNEKAFELAAFRGKKILIASINPTFLSTKSNFQYWDSLQKANPTLAIVLMQTSEGTTAASKGAEVFVPKSPESTVLTRTNSAKKEKGSGQNALMRWLTDVRLNGHFDLDVTTDAQLYFVSEAGVLYAVLEKGASSSNIDAILKQETVWQ
jgi:hypothetical protein